MIDHSKQDVITKQTWTDGELAQAKKLLDVCNAYEDLSMKLGLVMLRSRPGNETNDFLYYEEGELVGLLALNDVGDEDKELTGMVHPDYRRQGIFTALLAAAKEEAPRRGISQFMVVRERFSRSGQGFIAAIGAPYDFSEHRMVLGTFKERGLYLEQEHIHLQKVGPQDVLTIARITALSFGQPEEEVTRDVMQSINAAHSHYYVGKLGDEAIGSLNLFANDDEYTIYAFGILPEYRGRGFGRQMLEQLVKGVRAESQKRIALEVESENKNAIGLYRSCGFQETTTYGYYNLDIL